MARSSTNDPLEKFRFEIYFLISSNDLEEGVEIKDKDGKVLDKGTVTQGTALGFMSVQMPKITTNKISYREGDNLINVSSLSPGLSSTEDIALTKGIIKGPASSLFYTWASSIHGGGDTTADFNYLDTQDKSSITENVFQRKHIRIVMKDRTGKPARAWDVYNAFPVQFTPGSDLDATADDAKAIESLTIAYESFNERTVTDGVIA